MGEIIRFFKDEIIEDLKIIACVTAAIIMIPFICGFLVLRIISICFSLGSSLRKGE